MPHINLLPWREQLKKRRQNEYLAILAFSALIAFIIMSLVNSYYNLLIDNQEYRNQYLLTEIAVLDSKIKEIKDLKAKRNDLEQRMELIADLQRNRNLGAQIMDELVKVVPAGIYLVDLKKNAENVAITGKTESNNRVSSLMRQVESSYLLETPVLNSIITANEKTARLLSEFSMSMQIQDVQLNTQKDKSGAK
ncbi:PilN domain-containing protein [Catenovulum maritimum]|uniref:Pilus assembly protein PilN n=1 Tax=Catenovulum maritimum TaxID=1513271 RepID=A0A0J8GT74_9ALTE|nr:PilN domain-containing protein [Catenovulum maritimum]KMT65952.1 pilus assembly protein PilN [Catenovulum maritimum]